MSCIASSNPTRSARLNYAAFPANPSALQHLGKYALANQEWMQSGKVEWLTKNILEMRERGDRILLFSQFTQVLDLLEEVLETLQVKYLKLTGQTNVAERQDLVDQYYEDPEITVFLLSTRAGGLGLNLAVSYQTRSNATWLIRVIDALIGCECGDSPRSGFQPPQRQASRRPSLAYWTDARCECHQAGDEGHYRRGHFSIGDDQTDT